MISRVTETADLFGASPWHFAGFVVAFVFLGALVRIRRTYADAEFRRTVADDM